MLGELLKSGARILVYRYVQTSFVETFLYVSRKFNERGHCLCSGDQDSVVPLTGTRSLVNGLAKDLGLNTTMPYRNWFEGRQVSRIHKI